MSPGTDKENVRTWWESFLKASTGSRGFHVCIGAFIRLQCSFGLGAFQSFDKKTAHVQTHERPVAQKYMNDHLTVHRQIVLMCVFLLFGNDLESDLHFERVGLYFESPYPERTRSVTLRETLLKL